MPDERFFHRRAGRGDRANGLSDFEFRVWFQYVLSSDDFGVMRASATQLRSDNKALNKRPEKVVAAALEAVIASGLIRVFVHQGERYVYQHDWQDWQRVKYPRITMEPCPPPDAIAGCTPKTQRLFAQYPGGKKKNDEETVDQDSENVSEIDREGSVTTRAGAPAKRLTANANGQQQTADGERLMAQEPARRAPLVTRRRGNAAFEGARGLYVVQQQHQHFVSLLNRPDAEMVLLAWYASVCEQWATGDRQHETPDPDMFDFWRARFAERWPATPASRGLNPKTAGTLAAAAEIMREGR